MAKRPLDLVGARTSAPTSKFYVDGTTAPITPAHEVLDHHTALQGRLSGGNEFVAKFVQSTIDTLCDGVERAWAKQAERPDDVTADLLKRQLDNMVYPWPPEGAAPRIVQLLGRHLYGARTYQVTSEMVDVVTAMYVKSADQVHHIEEAELPSEEGFAWLDKPVIVNDSAHKQVSIRALSWGPQQVRWRTAKGERPSHPEEFSQGVRVAAWIYHGDPDEHLDHADTGTREAMAEADRRMGPLHLLHTFVIPLGVRFGGGPATAATPDDLGQWVHCLWMVLGTEIAYSAPAQLPRAARRRAARSIKWADVAVIRLRRARNIAPDVGEGHRAIDWSCRWVVQGHARHLEPYSGQHHPAMLRDGNCAVCGVRATWIRPYIKGPDGLTLKPTARQLFRLER